MSRLLFIFTFLASSLTAAKPELWQTMKQPIGEYKGIDFAFRQQYRILLSEFKTLNARFSLYVKKELWQQLDGEVHYTYIATRPPTQVLFDKVHRLELELNPRFEVAKDVELSFRNRYELLKFEEFTRLEQKFRQRIKVTFKKNVSISNEILYDIDTKKVFEYRFIPLELKFEMLGQHAYVFYAMIRWRDTPLGWNPQYVWGSMLEW